MQTKAMSVLCFSALIIFLLASNYNLSADVDVLKHIAEAERDVGYVGLRLKIYSRSRGSRTMEEIIIHRTDEDSYRKVVSVVGEQKPFAEENGRDSGQDDRNRDEENRRRDREFRWERQRSQFSIKEIELIAQNYKLERRLWGEKIAGHETDLLIIKPKHAGRPTKHIFFARKNGVILRVEDLDAAGVLRDMFVYTRISFDPKTVETKWQDSQNKIKREPRPDRTITLVNAEKFLKTKPIQPKYLPPGFQLQSVQKHQFRGTHLRLKYTDGLLDVYIFETTDKISDRGDQNRGTVIKIGNTPVHKHQRGPTYAFRWSTSDIHFFLLGAIPATEMQKVVESIILKKDKK